MKSASWLKLVGVAALATSVVIALQLPGYAKKPKVTVTTPSTSGNTVVPTVPILPSAPGAAANPGVGAPPPGGLICVPGTTPCNQPEPQPVAKDYFFCGTAANGTPTTYVNTPNGNIPLIRWVSHYFQHSGYSPTVRCQDVSQRFNRYYNEGTLNYVTTGFVNNQPVICVAGDRGGPCTRLLFTLKPGENATRAIQQLFDVRVGASGPLYESDDRIYIDMKPYTGAIQATR